MNGFSDKEMIEMVLVGQGKLQEQLALLVTKVDGIMTEGCAHRTGDLLRVEELEKGAISDQKAKNVITGGIIMALLSAVGALAIAIGNHLSGGK